jgi:hypothetical protein
MNRTFVFLLILSLMCNTFSIWKIQKITEEIAGVRETLHHEMGVVTDLVLYIFSPKNVQSTSPKIVPQSNLNQDLHRQWQLDDIENKLNTIERRTNPLLPGY